MGSKTSLLLFVLLIGAVASSVYFYNEYNQLKEEDKNIIYAQINETYSKQLQINELTSSNNLYYAILKTGADSTAWDDKAQAEQYYSEASSAYELVDWQGVQSNCRLARGYYNTASQGFLNSKYELYSYGITDKIIDLNAKMYDLMSEQSLNMYEACEYFESATVYYSTEQWAMGDGQIDSMSDKIGEHDRNVREYNRVLAEYNSLLKQVLK